MTTRSEIIAAARAWVGTPFRHQGRVKGEFVDCAGLIVGVARDLNLAEYEEIPYGIVPRPRVMEGVLDVYLDRIAAGSPGDVFWMRDLDKPHSQPRHVGIYTGPTIVHADSRFGACVEHGFDERHRAAVVRWYRFRGVEE